MIKKNEYYNIHFLHKMNVAVVGSRGFNAYDVIYKQLSQMNIIRIISGGAMGADKLAERYARENNIPITIFKPDWKLGKHAGLLRNTDIINSSDMVVAFWDGESTGTLDSINKAKLLNKQLITIRY